MNGRKTRRRGFSLIELLVVVTILGILAAVVVVNFAGATDTARQKAAAADIASYKSAVGIYHSSHGKYPDSLDVLSKPDPKYSNKAYIEKIQKDPWGNQYVYEKTSSGFKITCYGADGTRGGDGANEDIASDSLDKFR